ncbi:hypothetical protein [Thalassoroseus pseudoceratinae]|uniref:hypothetical protein n=1 Tax=Thalassoroseus pseudoceratinae TaxID=2713176 RepID=UPI00141F2383|nr:hypothetical protein [Thalassoroseus pseudoceratinae]
MTDTTALLEAGALLPKKTRISKKEQVDAISARAYQHPAMGERVVVRLTPDSLSQGDDLEMEFLGFDTPKVDGPLAHKRRQALGFPGWALIHDPDHARYALELVKEFKKAARKAKSKPGHAYDAYVEIAKRLGKSVAHFLPSFWEQAGREFIELGNNTYASRCFGKAREAERVHALDVDEDLRKNAFLEFALAGCLSNKAITEYGKELQKSHSPREAWNIFRELCVRRTLGGMPPWTSMATDIKQLVTSADLDVEDESERFLIEILDSPAISRAPMGFWKGYSAIITDLVKKNDEVAGQLLNLVPETNSWGEPEQLWTWLELLESWGILQNAWEAQATDNNGPDGGTAAWLTRFTTATERPTQRVFDLLDSASKRLKKDKTPVKLEVQRWGDPSICVDLLDFALERKIPVADPSEDCYFNLTDWASAADEAEDRPRDPVFVHRDQRFGKLLEKAVPNAAGQPGFEAAARGKEALKAARKAWLMGLIGSVGTKALPDAQNALNQLENQTTRETFREFPECYATLKDASVQPALVRNLQGGLIDEYGWPILEEVADRLNPDGKQTVQCFGAFPHLVVTDGQTAIVVNATEIVFEHELRLPKKAELSDLRYYDGQLCVFYETSRWESAFYWSNAPKKTFKEWHHGGGVSGAVVDMPDGGTFNGHRVVHAGDNENMRNTDNFFFDGEHYWILEWRVDDRQLREYDPVTETKGRWSMPSFLEDFVTSNTTIEQDACALMRLENVDDSPLGIKDNMFGWRVRYPKDGSEKSYECEGIDGRSWRGTLGYGAATALLDQPGTDARLPVSGYWLTDQEPHLWDPNGEYLLADFDTDERYYNLGQVTSLPIVCWHAMKPRSVAFSKKLRKTSATQAKKLIAAALKDIEAHDPDAETIELPETTAAIQTWMKKPEPSRFINGVAGVCLLAGRLTNRLQTLLETRDPEGESPVESDPVAEANVVEGIRQLGMQAGWGEQEPLLPHLYETAAFFQGEPRKSRTPAAEIPFEWFDLLDGLERKAWSKYWTDDKNEDAWQKLLAIWSDLPFIELPGKIRKIEGEFDGAAPFPVRKDEYDDAWYFHDHKKNFYLMNCGWHDQWTIVEYAPDGKFQVLPKFQIESETNYELMWSSEQWKVFLESIETQEKPLLDRDIFVEKAESLGVSAAEVGLLWFGCPNFGWYDKNFMPKPLREHLKLKVAEAAAAKTALKSLPDHTLTRLQDLLLDGDPAELWNTEDTPALNRLVAEWAKVVPKRLEIPAKLSEKLCQSFGYYRPDGELLSALASPQTHNYFDANAKWEIRQDEDDYYPELHADTEEHTFDESVLAAVTITIPFLNYHLPVGDAARNSLVDLHAATLKCLANANLLLPLGHLYLYSEKELEQGKQRLEQLLGKPKTSKGVSKVDDGLIIGLMKEHHLVYAIRPSKLKKAKDWKRLESLREVVMSPHSSYQNQHVAHLQLVNSDGYSKICQRIKKTPVADGGYETNPMESAPKLVSEVAEHYKIDESAAALYLQVLSLPDPTTANLKLWNDWKTAELNKAVKELKAKELVLEAKRSRAGRSFFLPGGWEALKLPHLPIETWKLPLFGIERDSEGGLVMPLSRILPTKPVHQLFHDAWERVKNGDEPEYEEVQ